MKIPLKLNDFDYLKNNLNLEKPLFCDTETHMLYNQLRLFQLYQEGWSHVLIFDFKDRDKNIKLIDLYYLIYNAYVVFHNYAYDASVIAKELNLFKNPFGKFEDTLLLSRLTFDNQFKFSLDDIYERVYGYDIYSQFGDKRQMQLSFLSSPTVDKSNHDMTDKQLQYAATDVYYMPLVFKEVKSSINKDCYINDKEFINNFLSWQFNGLPVNREVVNNMIDDIDKKLNDVSQQLPFMFNVNSIQQVRKLIKCNKSDKATLIKLKNDGNSNAALILEKRKLLKLKSFLVSYSSDRMKSYNSITTITGRMRSQGDDNGEYVNLLQIPRDLKSVFGFNNQESSYLVYCDYSNLEARLVCCETGDEVLEKTFKNNIDLHSDTCAKMFNIPISEVKDDYRRKAAKFLNFSQLYCGSYKSLLNIYLTSGGLSISEAEAKDYCKKWQELYSTVYKWHKWYYEQTNKGIYTFTTKLGRKYAASIPTEMCGICIQSIGADCTKKALNLLCERVKNVKVLLFFHDSIVLEAKNEKDAQFLSEQLGNAMLDAWFYTISFLKIKDLPMPLNVYINKSLKDDKGVVSYKTNGLISDCQYLNNEKVINTNSTLLFKETLIESNNFLIPQEFKNKTLLIDADTGFFISSLNAKNLNEAMENLKEYFSNIRKVFYAKSIELFITYGKCFRYTIYPDYKKNRIRNNNLLIKFLKEVAIKKFKNIHFNVNFEADDLIIARKKQIPDSLILSVDKDVLNSIQGKHFNLYSQEFITVSKEDARLWPYIQCLTGDSTDNIKGINGIGKVKAKKILDYETVKNLNDKELWQIVLNTYIQNGLTKEDALLNMQLVNMNQCVNNNLVLFNM